jgi:hypothetical protein
MRSISIPSLSHQTESFERLKRELGLAKGTPLSVRMAYRGPKPLSNGADIQSDRGLGFDAI